MNATDLRTKTKDELKAELLSLSKVKFNLRMQKATGQLAKSSEIKKVRRQIARVNTILNEQVN